ncbi:MAG: RidA family protein [Phycisphaerae bacterium]|nr:RidA family protein [Phycisphaerae bacterium]
MSDERRTYSSKAPWEAVVGYSRAVRVGSFIAVAGTTAWDPERGGPVGPNDAAAQARHIYGIVRRAIEALGGSMADVVRTRTFLVNIEDADAVGRVHAEFFAEVRPAATMLAGTKLVDARLLVEIEVDAIVPTR